MEKLNYSSLIVLGITVIVMAINVFIVPLSDWTVRIDGIIMLIALFTTVFSTAKMTKDKK